MGVAYRVSLQRGWVGVRLGADLTLQRLGRLPVHLPVVSPRALTVFEHLSALVARRLLVDVGALVVVQRQSVDESLGALVAHEEVGSAAVVSFGQVSLEIRYQDKSLIAMIAFVSRRLVVSFVDVVRQAEVLLVSLRTTIAPKGHPLDAVVYEGVVLQLQSVGMSRRAVFAFERCRQILSM